MTSMAIFAWNSRAKSSIFAVALCLGALTTTGCSWFSPRNVTGIWKGMIQFSEKGNQQWNGPAELTLTQQDTAIAGTLVFTHPQAGTVQIPISSGVLSNDALVLSGQSQFPMGSMELNFHGEIAGSQLTGKLDLTSRALLLGSHTDRASLRLKKQ
jgi:hypothetical protein